MFRCGSDQEEWEDHIRKLTDFYECQNHISWFLFSTRPFHQTLLNFQGHFLGNLDNYSSWLVYTRVVNLQGNSDWYVVPGAFCKRRFWGPTQNQMDRASWLIGIIFHQSTIENKGKTVSVLAMVCTFFSIRRMSGRLWYFKNLFMKIFVRTYYMMSEINPRNIPLTSVTSQSTIHEHF